MGEFWPKKRNEVSKKPLLSRPGPTQRRLLRDGANGRPWRAVQWLIGVAIERDEACAIAVRQPELRQCLFSRTPEVFFCNLSVVLVPLELRVGGEPPWGPHRVRGRRTVGGGLQGPRVLGSSIRPLGITYSLRLPVERQQRITIPRQARFSPGTRHHRPGAVVVDSPPQHLGRGRRVAMLVADRGGMIPHHRCQRPT